MKFFKSFNLSLPSHHFTPPIPSFFFFFRLLFPRHVCVCVCVCVCTVTHLFVFRRRREKRGAQDQDECDRVKNYQAELALLEQQNKARLIKMREEQDALFAAAAEKVEEMI